MTAQAMDADTVLHRPTAPARELVLQFHGVGASPEGFVPLAPALARATLLPGFGHSIDERALAALVDALAEAA